MSQSADSKDDGRAALQARLEMETLLKSIVVEPTVGGLLPALKSLATGDSVDDVAVRVADLARTLGRFSEVADQTSALHVQIVGPDGESSFREELGDVRREVSALVAGSDDIKRILASVTDSAASHAGSLESAIHKSSASVSQLLGEHSGQVASALRAVSEGLDATNARIDEAAIRLSALQAHTNELAAAVAGQQAALRSAMDEARADSAAANRRIAFWARLAALSSLLLLAVSVPILIALMGTALVSTR